MTTQQSVVFPYIQNHFIIQLDTTQATNTKFLSFLTKTPRLGQNLLSPLQQLQYLINYCSVPSPAPNTDAHMLSVIVDMGPLALGICLNFINEINLVYILVHLLLCVS